MPSFLRVLFETAQPPGFNIFPREGRHALFCAVTLLLVTGGAIALVLSSGDVTGSIGEAFGLRSK